MSEFYISGGNPLEGALRVQGAKNSVLPILAACLLTRQPVVLRGCPRLTDVTAALDILRHLGCGVEQKEDVIRLDPSAADGTAIPETLMGAMRSSVIFLGPILARNGAAELTCPGGCELGPRPINFHLDAMSRLGAEVEERETGFVCRGRLRGGEIRLPLPSVGATENAILAAMGAEGVTTVVGAAREPEIVELQRFLNRLGGHVRGAGTSVIEITGNRPLEGGEYTIMGDRIVAATLMSAGAAAGGEIRLDGVDWRHLAAVSAVLAAAGCGVYSDERGVTLRRDRRTPLKGVGAIRTAPYPGFPTDAQPPVMAALCTGEGETLFTETLFESRYRHVGELVRMGADITLSGQKARVRGVPHLQGARVEAADLRGGGALVAAALGAEGESVVRGLCHIDRGYESLETMINKLGGTIVRREHI